MSRTTQGRWSARLLGVFFALLAVFAALVASGQRGGDSFFWSLLLTVPFLGAGVAAVAAACCGVAAVRNDDRSVVVLASIVVGTAVVLFAAGEIVAPH